MHASDDFFVKKNNKYIFVTDLECRILHAKFKSVPKIINTPNPLTPPAEPSFSKASDDRQSASSH